MLPKLIVGTGVPCTMKDRESGEMWHIWQALHDEGERPKKCKRKIIWPTARKNTFEYVGNGYKVILLPACNCSELVFRVRDLSHKVVATKFSLPQSQSRMIVVG